MAAAGRGGLFCAFTSAAPEWHGWAFQKKVGQSCYLRSRDVRPRRQSGLYDTNMGGPKSLSFFIHCPIRENDAPTKKEILLLATPPSDGKTNTRVLLPDTHTLVEMRGVLKRIFANLVLVFFFQGGLLLPVYIRHPFTLFLQSLIHCGTVASSW